MNNKENILEIQLNYFIKENRELKQKNDRLEFENIGLRERFYEQLWEAYDQAAKQAKDDINNNYDRYSQGYRRPEPNLEDY